MAAAFHGVAVETVRATFEDLGEDGRAMPSAAPEFAALFMRDAEPDQIDVGQVIHRRESVVLLVQVAEWSAPQKGDTLEVADARRRITDVEYQDELNLVWRLETEAVRED